jgi:hypothetical protein
LNGPWFFPLFAFHKYPLKFRIKVEMDMCDLTKVWDIFYLFKLTLRKDQYLNHQLPLSCLAQPNPTSKCIYKVSLTGPKLDALELPLVTGVLGLNIGLRPFRLLSSSISTGNGSLPCSSYTTFLPSICGVVAALLSEAIFITALK